ncbi:MAG: LysR family transcriptional regulator [Peptococcaceae bacterium]|nr:LysR family transcriptional regulator [Peptococcaceae bacterium]
MKFKQLEAFLWVTELQSFTKAARQLYMSQPAVSFQIKALEENLEVDLFQRGDKKVILTEAGRLLYPEAKKMIKHYNKIKAGLDDLKGLKTGNLVIGASTIPGEYVMPLLIGGFKELYPGIQISLKIAGSGLVTRWVREREIDLGITGIPVEGDGIECTPWLQDEMVLIVNQSHPWAQKGVINLDELKNGVMILREKGSGTRRSLEMILEEKGIQLDDIPKGMELGSTRAVITAVEAGLGVSIVSRYAVKDVLQLKRISEVQVEGLNLNRAFFIIKLTQSIGGFVTEEFCKYLNDPEASERFLPK